MVQSVDASLKTAQKHAAAGRRAEARRAYEEAWTVAVASPKADPLLGAVAVLGYAVLALQDRAWPEPVLGRELDELLLAALEAAQGAKQRSRTLEGQLVLLRSQALFAKPKEDVACLDQAIEARHASQALLQEGAVEDLPWKAADAEALLKELEASHDRGGAEAKALGRGELLEGLRRLGGDDVADGVSTLFDAWSTPGSGPEGSPVLALTDFLQRFVELARRLDRPQDAQPCRAPCEGGLPETASELERELVALVSREGAGGWSAKASELQARGFAAAGAGALQELWVSLAPQLREAVETDAAMACGHSCSTCPTRHDCQLHGALKDIEDM